MACDARVTSLRDALVGAVAGLEVEVRRPVVTEVLAELTGGASSRLGDVTRCHGGVEPVPSHDLVHVRRGDQARVDEWVKPVDDYVRAPEPQHGETSAGETPELGRRLGERREAEQRGPIHIPGPTLVLCDGLG